MSAPEQKPVDEAVKDFIDSAHDIEAVTIEGDPDPTLPSFVKVSIGIVLNTQNAEEALTWAESFAGLLGQSPIAGALIESYVESVALVQRKEDEEDDA